MFEARVPLILRQGACLFVDLLMDWFICQFVDW